MGGMKYTYFQEEGNKLRKIDRFLVCPNFIGVQPTTMVIALPRVHSSHSPIILKPSFIDFGPSPFRFFNSWLLKEDFNKKFTEAWSNFCGFGTLDNFLKAKLKYVKGKIRKWKNEDSKKEASSLSFLRNKVIEIERIAESRMLADSKRNLWREDKVKLLEVEHIAKLDLQQKVKIKWLTDGDENSKFFSDTLKNKSGKNKIHGLIANGSWTTGPNLIKLEVFQFFAGKFKERWPKRPLSVVVARRCQALMG